MAFRIDRRYKRVYSSDGIITPIGRISWPALDIPKPAPPSADPNEPPGKPRYQVNLLLPKDSPKVIQLVEHLENIANSMVLIFNQSSDTKLASVSVLKDGDLSDPEKAPQDAGCWIMIARNSAQPEIRDATNNLIDATMPKAGMTCRMIIVPHLGAAGMAYKLEVLQVIEDDGTRFGGGRQDYSALLAAIDEEDEAPPVEVQAVKPLPKPTKPVAATAAVPSLREQMAAKVKKTAPTPTPTTAALKGKAAVTKLL